MSCPASTAQAQGGHHARSETSGLTVKGCQNSPKQANPRPAPARPACPGRCQRLCRPAPPAESASGPPGPARPAATHHQVRCCRDQRTLEQALRQHCGAAKLEHTSRNTTRDRAPCPSAAARLVAPVSRTQSRRSIPPHQRPPPAHPNGIEPDKVSRQHHTRGRRRVHGRVRGAGGPGWRGSQSWSCARGQFVGVCGEKASQSGNAWIGKCRPPAREASITKMNGTPPFFEPISPLDQASGRSEQHDALLGRSLPTRPRQSLQAAAATHRGVRLAQ